MKRLIGLFLIALSFASCEMYNGDESGDAYIYMGGGKWIFYDYDIIVISSISDVTVIKNDTVCIGSFGDASAISGGFLMKQNFAMTSKERRFVRGVTKWEFEGGILNCDFGYTNSSGYRPVGDPCYVEYGGSYLYTSDSQMKITNTESGTVTTYTFDTNNRGVAPPSKLTLLSPEIVTDLYHSNNSRDKAVTVRILLKFMR